MHYINEYFGPVFIIKKLSSRTKMTDTLKVFETCGNKSCVSYGYNNIVDTYCPYCGSRCGTFDIEIECDLTVRDVSQEIDEKLINPFNEIPESEWIFIPKWSKDSWLTALTKQHIVFKSLVRKCTNQSCDNLDYDIAFEHSYCSGCGNVAECQSNEQYESNFSVETAKILNSLSEKHALVPFEKPFNVSEANDNLEAFKQLKEIQEIVDLLDSIYGDGATSIQNRHVNFFETY